MRPVAAGFDDDEFVSAASFAEFGGVGGGRDADGFFVDEGAALRLGGGEALWKMRAWRVARKIASSRNGNLGCDGGTPPPPWSIGIIGLAEKIAN